MEAHAPAGDVPCNGVGGVASGRHVDGAGAEMRDHEPGDEAEE